MGCGASTESGANAQAPVASAPKPSDNGASAPAPAAAAAPAPAAAATPAPKDGASEWLLLTPAADLSQATAGAAVPGYYLVVHDNKAPDAPRMSVVCLADGSLSAVRIKDKGRGLAGAVDLECLFMISAEVAGKQQPLYGAMTSSGKAWLFKLSMKRRKWVAHGVKSFQLHPPAGEDTRSTNCEGARAFVEDGRLFLEYGNRGGRANGVPLKPWVARAPLDVKAVRKGKYAVDPAALDVTYWPAVLDNDPDVRQCADMGQAVGMARYGQLFAAAKDDEATETHFVSYIMERLPGAQAGGTENFKPLYRLQGAKVEAIADITKDVSIFATDDEGKGSYLTVLHRHTGVAWKLAVKVPEGQDPRLYGISGISPADPSILKEHDESSSESEQSEEEEEEQEEEEQQEEQQQEEEGELLVERLAEAVQDAREERQGSESARQRELEERERELEAREEALEKREEEVEEREERVEAREEVMEAREEAAEAAEEQQEQRREANDD